MKLLSIKVYSGRNIYSHSPVIRAEVDLGKYVDIPTCEIDNFNERLLELLPGLKEHRCSKGYVNGFYERLYRGTYLAHVMEHMALEIQNKLGYDLKYGKTRYLRDETVYCIVFAHRNKVAGAQGAKLAFDIIDSLLNNRQIDIQDSLEKIKQMISRSELGPSTLAIVEEAKKRKIPIMRIGENSLVQLGYGKYSRKIQATMTDKTNCMAVDIACDKELTNHMLRIHGIPVPEGKIARTVEEVINIGEELGMPVVVKPYNGNQGKGVSLNLSSKSEICRAFEIARKYSEKVLIEKYIEGKHYRLLVVENQVVAASQRIAAHVIGNGQNTIRELIEIENCNPLRGEGHQKPLTKIKIDDVMNLILDKANLNLESIPLSGEMIFLRENDNLSTGGIAIDVTDQVHPYNMELAISAAKIVELDIAGIDITTGDISRSIKDNGGAVIEINACPGIRMHHYPSKGEPRNVAKAIVDNLFPEGTKHSVPIISVTGTNGKTTTTRMIGKILKENGMVVGMTSTGGIYIDNVEVLKGDTTGPKSAEVVLMDKTIDVAVLETARGGIVNKGLGYDLADVGIVTNVGYDHIGIDGINTLEDMADVKSLVVEAVKADGYSVINGDDAFAAHIGNRASGNIVYFSMNGDSDLIKKHKEDGKKAVYINNSVIYAFDGHEEIPVINVGNIPATFGGMLQHNIENSLAAIGACYSLGVNISVIKKALSEFSTDANNNPGRFNVFEVANFKVIIDYGHNIDGYSRVLSGVSKLKSNRLMGVIGVPGDRTDLSILKIGELSGKYFDQVFIKEDKDLRGRNQKEVAELLKKGCYIGKLSESQISIVLDERDALIKAMQSAETGDIIVVFYENYDPLITAIEDFKTSLNNHEDIIVAFNDSSEVAGNIGSIRL